MTVPFVLVVPKAKFSASSVRDFDKYEMGVNSMLSVVDVGLPAVMAQLAILQVSQECTDFVHSKLKELYTVKIERDSVVARVKVLNDTFDFRSTDKKKESIESMFELDEHGHQDHYGSRAIVNKLKKRA